MLVNAYYYLWASADQLRANSGLKSTEYATTILGLIYLRFAESKYSKFETEINTEYNKLKGTRIEHDIHEIAIEKCGFYLPEEAKYNYIIDQAITGFVWMASYFLDQFSSYKHLSILFNRKYNSKQKTYANIYIICTILNIFMEILFLSVIIYK